MTSELPASALTASEFRSPPRTRVRAPLALALAAFAAASLACRSGTGAGADDARGVVVVNAPAAGEVRRVLVREGMQLDAGAPVVEIVVRAEGQSAAPTRTEDPQARAARTIQSSQSEVETARAEVVRAEVEVGRLTPLVAAGQASQGELDGARALYERAQQRFQQAQTAAQQAQSGLYTARQQSTNSPPASAPPAEQTVTARATSAGTVTAVSARVGDRVNAGQPLATLRADQ
jgi:biotin carboxyl carrier protein